MNEILKERAVRLAQLSAAIRTGLAEAETILPGINDQLSKLAAVGMTDFQIEGPVIYCRPAGVSSECTDEFVIYQAAIVTLGGIGATVWNSDDHTEHTSGPYGKPVDLSPRFLPYDKCPALVKAMLVSQAAEMLDCLIRDVRLLGS